MANLLFFKALAPTAAGGDRQGNLGPDQGEGNMFKPGAEGL
jgi:hypothetical protein